MRVDGGNNQEEKQKDSGESENDEGRESWVAGSASSTEAAVDVVGRQARILSEGDGRGVT